MIAHVKYLLLADDDPDILSVTRECLKERGNVNVFCAIGGEELIGMTEDLKVDAILLDVRMPGMDGVETLQKLRKINRLDDTPVIFLTASTENDMIDNYMAAGAAGVIPKPYDPMFLYDQVCKITTKFNKTFA